MANCFLFQVGMYKEKWLLKLLSKRLFWALYATPDQMTIPLNKLP